MNEKGKALAGDQAAIEQVRSETVGVKQTGEHSHHKKQTDAEKLTEMIMAYLRECGVISR